MRIHVKPAIGILLCGLALCASPAQESRQKASHRKPDRTLTSDDGLSVIAAALDPKVRRYAGHDCSHLVHAIYQRAGFPYTYSSSDDLYLGVEGFQRITEPQPGDLIVWPGHVGIVVRPSRKVFFSFMRAGPAIDNYDARYWISRGHCRFYRYVKNDPCPGCTRLAQRSRVGVQADK